MVDVMVIGDIDKDYDTMKEIAMEFLEEGHSVLMQRGHCPCNFAYIENSNTIMAVETDEEYTKKLIAHAQEKRIRIIIYNPHKMDCVVYQKKISDLILEYYNEHGQGPQSIILGNEVVKGLGKNFFGGLSSKEGYDIPEVICSNTKDQKLIKLV